MHVHALESQRRRLARRAGTADRPGSVWGRLGPAGTMAGVGGGWCSAPGGGSRGGAGLRFRCRDGVRPGEVQGPQVAAVLTAAAAVLVALTDTELARAHR
jgi:hypothetical protein